MGRRAKQEYVNNKDFLAAMIEYKARVHEAKDKENTKLDEIMDELSDPDKKITYH